MKHLPRRLMAVATATLLGAPLLAVTPATAADDVTINLVGINDFHGRIDSATVQWAGTIKQLEAEAPGNSLLVSAGDNIGASLFTSAVDDDNPTIDVLNAVGLDASATGNHEFDKGYADLVNRVVPRADFPILGANVTKKSDGSAALPASKTFTIDGVRIAVIGAVTQETSTLVSPDGIADLTFGDPVEGINAEVDRLEALDDSERPDVMVASFHEGAPDGTLTLPQAVAGSSVFRHLVEDTSPDVDAIFMGHTHQKYAYEAPVPGASGKTRPIIQTGNYGENVGQIKLQVNPDSGEVTSFTLKNTARLAASDADLIKLYPDLAEVKSIRDAAVTAADKVGSVPKGEITGDITRAFTGGTTEDRGSESTAGGLVADALLETVAAEPAGADIGIVNPGGLRPPDLTYAGVPGSTTNTDGVVTFAELNSVLPFANNLNSVRLSGASLKKVLEQQWQRDASGNVPTRAYLQLGVSKNVHYTFDATRPEGSRITSVTIDGKPLEADQQYKVATFSFLATGGDNFRAFKEGVNTDTGLVDRDGWVAYFEKNSPVSPDFAKRSVEVRGVAAKYGVGTKGSVTFPRLDLTSLGSPANTRIYSKIVYGDGATASVPSQPVSSGAATVPFTLPEGRSGAMRLESEAFPSRTKIVVPLDVTGATVTATAPKATFGDDVPVAVTVTGPSGTPAGEVTLTNGDTKLGSGTLSDGGTATIPVDSEDLGAGTTTVTATYAGDGAGYPATSGSVDVVIAKAGTTTTAPDPAPTKVSDDAKVAVTVESSTGTEPTGAVTVSDGTRVIGSAQLAEGSASVSADLAGLSVGPHELTVAYAGDADHEASTTTVDVDVVKGSAGLTATATGSPYGTSTVVQVVGAPGATGVVYVGNGSTVVGIGFLVDGKGSVALPATALVPGTYALGVFFGGSDSYDAVDTTVGVTIAKGATSTRKVSVSPRTIVRNRTKPFVTVTVTGEGFTVDGGTVTLRQGGKSYRGTVKGGKARIRLGKITSSGKAKKVTATYSGNGVANGSSTSFTVKVLKKK
ncbi:5'-nucleotidase C-terminal domain-containing protein [Aeromicrobium fastidiosum]|uniref:Bifunctional metallophosphatase/5'-nucleotidase n=1 Tax=Aeromicrobium fastidiosum TaxID=52699 RepID=A0A641AI81_9ACTN|nr:5'-nucleotidase C-terminal domain-containing protein [Aeromicrobium fastidiosum]KAA1374567.1 hypothetical protein ESP62_014295 [Aeromicrobium fastidiosum]MBP2390896.1 5'-nucleotidase [Aeromicrobium fastidiosum]